MVIFNRVGSILLRTGAIEPPLKTCANIFKRSYGSSEYENYKNNFLKAYEKHSKTTAAPNTTEKALIPHPLFTASHYTEIKPYDPIDDAVEPIKKESTPTP